MSVVRDVIYLCLRIKKPYYCVYIYFPELFCLRSVMKMLIVSPPGAKPVIYPQEKYMTVSKTRFSGLTTRGINVASGHSIRAAMGSPVGCET